MKDNKSINSDLDAIFIGWQMTNSEDIMALYNITAVNHPSYQSTVTEKTLIKLNLRFRKQHNPKSREINN